MNKMKMRDFHHLRYLVTRQLESKEGQNVATGEELQEHLEDANII